MNKSCTSKVAITVPYLMITALLIMPFLVFGNSIEQKAIQDDSLSVQNELRLEISFEIIDTTKTIIVAAKERKGDKWSLIDEPIECSITTPTLFGDLLIEQVLLSDGVAYIDFPHSLPGDRNGTLEITARIIDNEKYGDVKISKEINWAGKVEERKEQHGKLWTTDPPIWMLIVFITFLLSVWTAYIFVFVKVMRVHKAGMQDNS